MAPTDFDKPKGLTLVGAGREKGSLPGSNFLAAEDAIEVPGELPGVTNRFDSGIGCPKPINIKAVVGVTANGRPSGVALGLSGLNGLPSVHRG